MPVRYYKYDKPFVLENGERLPELQIAYRYADRSRFGGSHIDRAGNEGYKMGS